MGVRGGLGTPAKSGGCGGQHRGRAAAESDRETERKHASGVAPNEPRRQSSSSVGCWGRVRVMRNGKKLVGLALLGVGLMGVCSLRDDAPDIVEAEGTKHVVNQL